MIMAELVCVHAVVAFNKANTFYSPLLTWSNITYTSGAGQGQGQVKELDCSEGPGLCAHMITFISILLILVSLPLSLLFVVKVVQEYERAVIFRLGRLLAGGARGPGVFFIIPCVDVYEKIDMRTQTYEIPPQEVGAALTTSETLKWFFT